MLLLLIMLEIGFAFNHKLTVGYATREGARTGAALANGGATSCAVPEPGRARSTSRSSPRPSAS